MDTGLDLGKLDRQEKAFDDELATMRQQIAEIEKDARFSPEHKAARIAAMRTQSEAALQARVKSLWDVAQSFERGAAIERQAIEQAHEKSFDHSRLTFLAQEYAAKLSAARSLDAVAMIRQEVMTSGDSHRARAARVAILDAAQRFKKSDDPDVRVRANSLLGELARESDTTPEIDAARQRESDAVFRVRTLANKVRRIGEQIRPGVMWQAGFFDAAMGIKKQAGVVWDKSNPMTFQGK